MNSDHVAPGWIAVGIGNSERDEKFVAKNNVIGGIQAARAADICFGAEMTARFALQHGIGRGAKMTLLR